jgi:hypothetical protein
MSVAEAFAHFDANTMVDNAMARVRRTIGVRALPSTTNVQDYLDAQGLVTMVPANTEDDVIQAANESVAHTPYQASTVGRRWSRRARRALRG